MVSRPRESYKPCWIGLDGTRIGWSVCIIEANGDMEFIVISKLETIWKIRNAENICAMGIDMPLALAEKAERGGRKCEREARALLANAKKNALKSQKRKQESYSSEVPFVGPSSIFTPPSRPALKRFENGGIHEQVSEANRMSALKACCSTTSNNHEKRAKKRQKKESEIVPGLGLSIQTFNIMPKILELDRFVAQGIQESRFQFLPLSANAVGSNCKICLFECHPEVAFLTQSRKDHDDVQIKDRDALPTKKSSIGRELRMASVLQTNLFIKHEEEQRQISGMRFARDLSSLMACLVPKATTSVNHYLDNDHCSYVSIPSDDVLDSIVCAIAAKRFTEGGVNEIGGPSSEEDRNLDFRGVPMTIFV